MAKIIIQCGDGISQAGADTEGWVKDKKGLSSNVFSLQDTEPLQNFFL